MICFRGASTSCEHDADHDPQSVTEVADDRTNGDSESLSSSANALLRQYRTGSGEYPDVTVFIRMLRFAKPCNWVAVRINFSTMVTCTSIIVMSILKMKIDY